MVLFPFANLVKPYHVMKEIWQVSSNPQRWASEGTSPVLGFWWAFWLLTNFCSQIQIRVALKAESMDALKISTVAGIAAGLFDIALHLTVFLLIFKIIQMQRSLVERSAA